MENEPQEKPAPEFVPVGPPYTGPRFIPDNVPTYIKPVEKPPPFWAVAVFGPPTLAGFCYVLFGTHGAILGACLGVYAVARAFRDR